ncbi:hypothetical protein PP484_gp30 [Gordonia phage Madeline]|uniref:Competence protein CoiA nuclease-like domain-containing protein n=1 Tax=Gordonia phage Madeline TaxID=2591189 RepID=A0A514A2X4_9CAUD|nr:hypothetical protein PP484_gp30 [Gordonia phage Madeline]QDH47634.1 hypothetical protein SEA_MADELINE_30 [Gordonia phage Madeline]
MTTLARLYPEDRIIDLTNPTAEDWAVIDEIYQAELPAKSARLFCQEPGGGAMYIRKTGENYYAAHYPGTGIEHQHSIGGESDAHKRQKEYYARAATDQGYNVEIEQSTGSGTRPDVTVFGDAVKIGGEVQYSDLSERSAKIRNGKTMKAGYTPMWVNTKGLQQGPSGGWLYKIPSVSINVLPWETEMPTRGAATALGARKVGALQCTPLNFGTCPEGHRLHCGRFHADLTEPWTGLTLDSAVGMAAAETIVPISCPVLRPDDKGSIAVYWVSDSDARTASELYGFDVRCTKGLAPNLREARSRMRSRTASCTSPKHQSQRTEASGRTDLGPPCNVCGKPMVGQQSFKHYSC